MEVRNLKEKSGPNLRVERNQGKEIEVHHSWAVCFVQQDTEDSSLILKLTMFHQNRIWPVSLESFGPCSFLISGRTEVLNL